MDGRGSLSSANALPKRLQHSELSKAEARIQGHKQDAQNEWQGPQNVSRRPHPPLVCTGRKTELEAEKLFESRH